MKPSKPDGKPDDKKKPNQATSEAQQNPKDFPAATSTMSYIKDIPKDVLLTKEEQLYYGKLYQTGSPEEKALAMEKLVASSLFFVIKIAKSMAYTELELDDLIQEGNIGLMKSVEKYDYKKGLSFTTYAVWWIRQSILKAIKDKASNVRLPSHVYDLQRRINEQEAKLERKGIRFDIRTLAKRLGKKTKDIERHKAYLSMRYTQNLEEKFVQSKIPVSTVSEASASVLNQILEEDVKSLIEVMLNRNVIGEKEIEVLCLRYGIEAHMNKSLRSRYLEAIKEEPLGSQKPKRKAGLTLNKISLIMGLSKERVRQVEAKALKALQDFKGRNPDLFKDLF